MSDYTLAEKRKERSSETSLIVFDFLSDSLQRHALI